MDATMKFMSPREIAVTLNLPLSWIYAQAGKGDLPHYKWGKYLRFNLAEVQVWMQQHRRGGQGGQTAEMAG
jgi:excisionase family DNA binding protein